MMPTAVPAHDEFSLARLGLGLAWRYSDAPRTPLSDFKRLMWPEYEHARHMEALDAALTQVADYAETGTREGMRTVVISMPPRHGKTSTAGFLFPAWLLSRNPDLRVMLVSYSASLVRQTSRRIRNLMYTQAWRSHCDVRLAQDSHAVDAWNIAGRAGGMDALGIGGSVTGKGADILVCDDLVSGREAAESEVQREAAWTAFLDDVLTRRQGVGCTLLIGTRWHVDDPLGRVLRGESPLNVDLHLRLPALADSDDDPLGREPGVALWPERFPASDLEAMRHNNYSWQSLYQQQPVQAMDGLVKREWLQPAATPQRRYISRIVIGVDPATTANRKSDETGIMVVGQHNNGNWYVLEDLTTRATPEGWARIVADAYHRWQASEVIAEVNQGGDMVVQTIHSVDRAVRVRKARAVVSKVLRAEPVASLYQQGLVWHCGDLQKLERQLLEWIPGERSSPDRLDALVYAVMALLPQQASMQDVQATNVWKRRDRRPVRVY